MREWYDNQKKPEGHFRKPLRRIDKINSKCDVITAEKQKRLTKLNRILEELGSGQNIKDS